MKNNGSFLLKITILFLVYFFSARAGLMLDAVGGFATLVWVPTGLSLASLILFGNKLWPAVFLGAFLANWSSGATFEVASFIALGNTLEALSGAFLLKKVARFRPNLERIRDVASLAFFGGFLSTIFSATVGASTLVISGTVESSRFNEVFSAWWVGDFISNLTVAPLILVFFRAGRLKLADFKTLLEIIGVAIFIAITCAILFFNLMDLDLGSPNSYLIFPSVILASLRFAQKGAVFASFFIAVFTTYATARGMGPFASGSLTGDLLLLHRFLAVVSLTAMTLGAVESERRNIAKKKDIFISIASHELKTPITVIKSYAELLLKILQREKNTKLQKYVSNLDFQIDRLIKLVSDLLDVSRIEEEKLDLKKEYFSFQKLLNEVIGDISKTAIKHRILVVGKFEKKIYADKERLSQVLTNLISNAFKFSPRADSINIKVEDKNNYLVVSVTDFGIGISKENQERIFERFFQVNTKIRPSFAGLGLGLYISSEIIRQHRGEMWVSSEKGKGSTFTFKIPIRKRRK